MPFFKEKYSEISNYVSTMTSNLGIAPKIIAVSKNHPVSSIIEAIDFGVKIFAENKLQEALLKFNDFKKNHKDLELHMTGSIQTNKVKKSLEIFDYFHTLDRDKLANKLYLGGIENANAYDPTCHKQEIYKDYLQKKPYEISDDIMKRHLSLPMYCELTEKDIEYIVNKLVESVEELNDSN